MHKNIGNTKTNKNILSYIKIITKQQYKLSTGTKALYRGNKGKLLYAFL